MTAERLAIFLAGLVGIMAVTTKKTLALGGRLSPALVSCLVANEIEAHNFHVDPAVAAAIIEIESARNPMAQRYEPHIQDASIGLMQTLSGTASWLARDMGYTAYGRDIAPERLLEPAVSVYFGCAYLDWLSRYQGRSRPLEWIVRAYNGGPGGTDSRTDGYWSKFLAAYDGPIGATPGLF